MLDYIEQFYGPGDGPIGRWSVNPATNRSNDDRAWSDNNSSRSDNNWTYGYAPCTVHTSSADHGARFCRRQGDKASH